LAALSLEKSSRSEASSVFVLASVRSSVTV
jgi:hypothetical protein